MTPCSENCMHGLWGLELVGGGSVAGLADSRKVCLRFSCSSIAADIV